MLETCAALEELMLEIRAAMEELMLETRATNMELEEDFMPLLLSAEISAVAQRQLGLEEAITEVFADVFTDTGRTRVIARTWTRSSRTWRPPSPLHAPQATTHGHARGGLRRARSPTTIMEPRPHTLTSTPARRFAAAPQGQIDSGR